MIVTTKHGLPWWRPAVAHPPAELDFLNWVGLEFGSEWLERYPDEMVQILQDYISFNGYDIA